MATRYTFSTKGSDGTVFYPKRFGDQISWIADWTTDVSKAITWEKPEDFDCLMAEYCDTEVIEIKGQTMTEPERDKHGQLLIPFEKQLQLVIQFKEKQR